MTSREFINRQFRNSDGKSRSLSSIYKDGKGQIYSYYHHYPLLFEVGGLTFRNTRGYSSTTGKHISWAGGADVDVILSGCNQYSWRNSENRDKVPYMLYERANNYNDAASDKKVLIAISKDLVARKHQLEAERDAKKRKDTQVYQWLEREYLEVIEALKKVDKARGIK